MKKKRNSSVHRRERSIISSPKQLLLKSSQNQTLQLISKKNQSAQDSAKLLYSIGNRISIRVSQQILVVTKSWIGSVKKQDHLKLKLMWQPLPASLFSSFILLYILNQNHQKKILQPIKVSTNNMREEIRLFIQQLMETKCKEWSPTLFKVMLSWSNTSSTQKQDKLQENNNKIRKTTLMMFNSDNVNNA